MRLLSSVCVCRGVERVLGIAATVVLALGVSGCGELRVRESKIETSLPQKAAPIVVGETNRATVRQLLGEPWIASDYWRFDLFRLSDRSLEVAVILIPVWVATDDVHGYLLVSYDEDGKVSAHGGGMVRGDSVSRRSLLSDPQAGSTMITAGETTFAVDLLKQIPSIFVSPQRRDHFLKSVGTADTQCVLVTGCVVGLCRIGLAIDGAPARLLLDGFLGSRAFGAGSSELTQQSWVAPLIVASGVHRLEASHAKTTLLDAGTEFSCVAGEALFADIEVAAERGPSLLHWNVPYRVKYSFSKDPPEWLRKLPMLIWREGQWLVPQEPE